MQSQTIDSEKYENMISVIAHEVRAPLSTSCMFIESIKSFFDENQLHDYSRTVDTAMGLINLTLSYAYDLLDSRTLHRRDKQVEVFCLADVLEFIQRVFMTQCAQKGINISYEILPFQTETEQIDPPVMIKGDSRRLQ